MGRQRNTESAVCRECHRDQCPLHCIELGVRPPEAQIGKGTSEKSTSLDYLKVKGGQSG